MKIGLKTAQQEAVSISHCRRLRLAAILFLWLASFVAPLFAQQPAGPPSATQHRQEGIRDLQNREPKKALDHFRAAAQMDPQDAESQFFIGAILCDSGQAEAAIPELRRAIEL
ncbi:MAG: hypothetical protein ACREAM_22425, partial [Blastocatellia bacterium]